MEGCCPSGALRTFACYTEPVNLLVTGTSPDDSAAAEGPEPISGQRLCLQGKAPKVSRGGWSPLKTLWGIGCDWWELSEAWGAALAQF